MSQQTKQQQRRRQQPQPLTQNQLELGRARSVALILLFASLMNQHHHRGRTSAAGATEHTNNGARLMQQLSGRGSRRASGRLDHMCAARQRDARIPRASCNENHSLSIQSLYSQPLSLSQLPLVVHSRFDIRGRCTDTWRSAGWHSCVSGRTTAEAAGGIDGARAATHLLAALYRLLCSS